MIFFLLKYKLNKTRIKSEHMYYLFDFLDVYCCSEYKTKTMWSKVLRIVNGFNYVFACFAIDSVSKIATTSSLN